MASKNFNYKKALEEIESIVRKIESEEVEMDELTTMVKRAADLIKQCKSELKNTGQELEDIIENLDD